MFSYKVTESRFQLIAFQYFKKVINKNIIDICNAMWGAEPINSYITEDMI